MKLLVLIGLLSSEIINFASTQCIENPGQLIQNPKSGLVLDGSQTIVKVQVSKNTPEQLWLLESNPDGSVYIINKKTKKVLAPTAIQGSSEVVTVEKSDSKCQKWFIQTNKTIKNAAVNLVLDIYNENLQPGEKIIVFREHDHNNQIFKVIPASATSK